MASGIWVGSCVYSDLCVVIRELLPDNFNPDVCLPELLDFGIDCTCPLKLKKGLIDMDSLKLDLPDASTTIFTFLASGEFDITAKMSDQKGSYSCVVLKFSVRPRK